MAKLLLDTRAIRPRTRFVQPLEQIFDRLFKAELQLHRAAETSPGKVREARRKLADLAANSVEEAYLGRLEGMRLFEWAIVTALEKSAVTLESRSETPALRKLWRERIITEFVRAFRKAIRGLIPEPKGRPASRTPEERAALKRELQKAFPRIKAQLVRRSQPSTRKAVIAKMSERRWGSDKVALSASAIDHYLSNRRR